MSVQKAPKEAPCPHCIYGIGDYKKGWDMKKKIQKKGGTKGETSDTGEVLRISLYKCRRCRKLFRKGHVEKRG